MNDPDKAMTLADWHQIEALARGAAAEAVLIGHDQARDSYMALADKAVARWRALREGRVMP